MSCLEQLERNGFAIVPGVLRTDEVGSAIRAIDENGWELGKRSRGGTRDVLESIAGLHSIAQHPKVIELVRQVLGSNAFVARSTLFDKTPEANWKVPWHQDLTIAVMGRREVRGYGPWSKKAGVQHVQPPTEVLERMLTIRLHLDPCPPTNGALRVLPGSHRLGRINQNEASRYVDEARAFTCAAQSGDALLMRPLLFHVSSASLHPGHRRVLHFDYATEELAGELQWRLRTPVALNNEFQVHA